MYVAITHFKIIVGQELLFETLWKERESYLHTMQGYRGLFLMRGATEKRYTSYVSQFIWNTQADFEAWTQSDEFVKAHIQFGDTSVLFNEKPEFEGLTIVLQETAGKPRK
jgi:heme-degrading monooxygenase HmoA